MASCGAIRVILLTCSLYTSTAPGKLVRHDVPRIVYVLVMICLSVRIARSTTQSFADLGTRGAGRPGPRARPPTFERPDTGYLSVRTGQKLLQVLYTMIFSTWANSDLGCLLHAS